MGRAVIGPRTRARGTDCGVRGLCAVSFRWCAGHSELAHSTSTHRLSAHSAPAPHIWAVLTGARGDLSLILHACGKRSASRMLVRFGRRVSAPHLQPRPTASLPASTKIIRSHGERSKLTGSLRRTHRDAYTSARLYCTNTSARAAQEQDPDRDGGKGHGPSDEKGLQVHQTEHAVISTFDLFSIGGE